MIIEKRLSDNDLGKTGCHQAGILIPKEERLLSFFPKLDRLSVNPRRTLSFYDASGERWKFNFIYYNNKLRGGTRNEYRLTCMTKFLRQNLLDQGDYVILRYEDGKYYVSTRKEKQPVISENENEIIIELNDWRMIGE